MRVSWSLLAASLTSVLVACGGKPASTTTTPPTDEAEAHGEAITPSCGYAFKVLYIVADDALQAEAAVEVDRATTLLDAGDPATAARRFVGCAEVLRAAPADDARADENAAVCYFNASYAFATAGQWASAGRAALEAAAAAEAPATAAYIRERLIATPPVDCAP